ncbi:MAG: hypothetical protein AB7V18_06310 [Pyrinomonadaceae bacterium]
MMWKVEEIPELRGFVVEWAEPGNYLFSRRDRIFRSNGIGHPIDLVAAIPAPMWRSLASRSRLCQRLLRFSVNDLIPLEDGEIFASFDRSVGLVRKNEYLPLGGLRRPCRVLRSAIARSPAGDLFFGEYIDNKERGPIALYKYRSGTDRVELVREFDAGSARHIHGIYADPFEPSLICLTGDAPGECAIYRSTDGFETMDIVGSGDESWRAVSCLFAEDAIYYGTDAEHQENKIFRIDRETGDRSEVGKVSGTVFYSQIVNGEMFFATTAEDAPSQSENVAAVWHVDPAAGVSEVVRFEKDRWNPTLFGFGTIYFPHVQSRADRLIFHVYAANMDNRTFEISLKH